MSWATGVTMATYISRLDRFFKRQNNVAFDKLALVPQDYYDIINAALDEIYQACFPQPEEWTVTTVAGTGSTNTGEIAMDGSSGNLSSEIGGIRRVDFSGEELPYHYFYPDQITLWLSGDTPGTPDGWYVKTVSGVNYLGLAADGVGISPDVAATVRVFGYRIPAAITATSGTVNIWRDLHELVLESMIVRMHDNLRQYDDAQYRRQNYVEPGMELLRKAMPGRLGRKASRRETYGPQDLLQ